MQNSLVEEMEFTLGRIKTQVGPLTQGKATRELNLWIMSRSNWDLTPENVVQDHHRVTPSIRIQTSPKGPQIRPLTQRQGTCDSWTYGTGHP